MSFLRECVLLQTLCLLLAGIQLVASQDPTVDLPGLGQIEGNTLPSYWSGRTIYRFMGIPYAEPPIGDLRFKRPLKFATPWNETLECKALGPICPQDWSLAGYMKVPFHKPREEEIQDEDCLSINVYTPKLTEGGIGTGLPVMVFIHGGAFIGGSADYYDPPLLLEKDVLLVVPQYRLGPLGFLSLKNEDIPGNQGMLDVVLALEWVRDNIEHFGGDPSRVTVFGESAGAAAVTSLLFSPLVEDGLFQRMIAESGSVLGTWVTDPDPVAHGTSISQLAGCFQTNPTAQAQCLRNKSVNTILNAHNRFLLLDVASGGRFVGGHHLVWDEAGDKSFMRKNPKELFESGNFKKVPLIAGINKHEGTGFFSLGHDYLFVPFNLTNDPHYLSWTITRRALEYGGIEDSTGYTAGFIRDQYFTPEELGDYHAMLPGLIDIVGVALLKASTYILASENSFDADTYLYSFNFWGEHSYETNPDKPYDNGIAHGHELPFLFSFDRIMNEKDDAMAQQMVELWTNFAINGKPTAAGVPDWLPMSSPEGPYLKFDTPHQMYDNFVDEEYMIAVKEGITDSNKR